MKKIEFMRRLICLLFVWNLIISSMVVFNYFQDQKQNEEKLNAEISKQESLNYPPLEIIEEF